MTSHNSHQNVIVMRHGERIDYLDPTWIATAAKPWDPPLAEAGKVAAFCAGRNLVNEVRFPIHRVIVSPLLRCVETAVEVVAALEAEDGGGDMDDPSRISSSGLKIDPSKTKVSIEYGLIELRNRLAKIPPPAPENGIFTFNIPEIEAMFPKGTIDQSVERVYKELPRLEETMEARRARYATTIITLADKFPSENLLLVTHGEGVGVAYDMFTEDEMELYPESCRYTHLQRPITTDDKSSKAREFKVILHKGHTGLIFLRPLSSSM